MSTVLYISTIVLNVTGVALSAIYIWLNAFSGITDLAVRNNSILKITRASMSLSLLFALLSCLLSNNNLIWEAISSTARLYSIIAISWLIVLLFCVIAMLFSFVSKAAFRADLSKSIRKIFVIALWGAIVGMVFAWLFS